MELYKEMIIKLVEAQGHADNISRLLESECYKALEEIKAVIEDDGLSDADCFDCIERIICIFEGIGSGFSSRHDFG